MDDVKHKGCQFTL